MAETKTGTEATQPELKTYRGNCHCGAFVFETRAPEVTKAYECNCSICSKKAYLWFFPPPGGFAIVKGDEADLAEYKFASGRYAHKFCRNCGIGIMARNASNPPGRQLGLNLRTFQVPLDKWELEKQSYDGAALSPAHAPAKFAGAEPTAGPEDGNVYHGSCHCGAVTLAVRVRPLDQVDLTNSDERVVECNCTLCQRGGYVWIYPKAEQSVVMGAENLDSYGRVWRKSFCRICGVHMTNENTEMTEEEEAALPPLVRGWRASRIGYRPINLRALDDFDVRSIETYKLDGRSAIPGTYVDP